MWSYVAVFTAISIVHANLINCTGPIEDRSRIIGGNNADIKDFPHQISLRYKGTHRCGGSIYKSNMIITAGHCVRNRTCELISIGAGSSYWATPQQVANPKKCIIHEQWNKTTIKHDYDIAILVLDKHFNFNEVVQPIRLAERLPVPGDELTVIGWGLTKWPNGTISDRLQKVGVEFMSNSQCQAFNSTFYRLTDRMLCAGIEAGEKGPCNHDSGGPLINGFNRELLGVVSWGDRPCGPAKNPGVYASIPNLYDWIVKTVEENVDL